MRLLELHKVYYMNGRLVITLTSFSKLINYNSVYLGELIRKLFKAKIYIAYKWKRNYYVFIPKKPLKNLSNSAGDIPVETVETTSGDNIDVDWQAAVNYLPESVVNSVFNFSFSFVTREETLYITSASHVALSSTLSPKTVFQFVPLNLTPFPATTDYKYGYYISYDPNKMSTFNSGTNGTLKSTQIPQAFFEVCRALDAAENARNGANPGLTPRRNLSTTVSFDTGTIAVAATIPIVVSIQTDGTIKVLASDYLGTTYSSFDHGGGTLTSSNIVAAFLETASLLSAAEKAVTPIENQPNNIQIQVDVEAGSATVSANLPFTTAASTNGDVTILAIDYL